MSEQKQIKAIHGDEPKRENEYAWGFTVGYDGVTRIERREDYFGDHSILWFDVFKGDDLHASMGGRHVAVVLYVEAQP